MAVYRDDPSLARLQMCFLTSWLPAATTFLFGRQIFIFSFHIFTLSYFHTSAFSRIHMFNFHTFTISLTFSHFPIFFSHIFTLSFFQIITISHFHIIFVSQSNVWLRGYWTSIQQTQVRIPIGGNFFNSIQVWTRLWQSYSWTHTQKRQLAHPFARLLNPDCKTTFPRIFYIFLCYF